MPPAKSIPIKYDLLMDDPKVMQVLIDSFSKGFTDSEACFAAGISKGTLYDYIKQNPEFTERKEQLKKNPILTAKSTVVDKLADNDKVGVATAKWYLERKTKEFKPPDKSTNIYHNQLTLLTNDQIKDRLAHKLAGVLSQGDDSQAHANDSDVDVTDAQIVTDDMSNTETKC